MKQASGVVVLYFDEQSNYVADFSSFLRSSDPTAIIAKQKLIFDDIAFIIVENNTYKDLTYPNSLNRFSVK